MAHSLISVDSVRAVIMDGATAEVCLVIENDGRWYAFRLPLELAGELGHALGARPFSDTFIPNRRRPFSAGGSPVNPRRMEIIMSGDAADVRPIPKNVAKTIVDEFFRTSNWVPSEIDENAMRANLMRCIQAHVGTVPEPSDAAQATEPPPTELTTIQTIEEDPRGYDEHVVGNPIPYGWMLVEETRKVRSLDNPGHTMEISGNEPIPAGWELAPHDPAEPTTVTGPTAEGPAEEIDPDTDASTTGP